MVLQGNSIDDKHDSSNQRRRDWKVSSTKCQLMKTRKLPHELKEIAAKTPLAQARSLGKFCAVHIANMIGQSQSDSCHRASFAKLPTHVLLSNALKRMLLRTRRVCQPLSYWPQSILLFHPRNDMFVNLFTSRHHLLPFISMPGSNSACRSRSSCTLCLYPPYSC